ncbi:MAG: helix-turn-helix transcriptional regulator [Acetatifactor sp.]|nr:helix-turn-helix transcriptional regulator [Acetatifactor sp.]
MFASLLKQLRAKKGVSQLELAKAIGVSNGNVGDWERGRSKPGYDALIALSRFFEVSAGRLLEIPEVSDLVCDGVPLSEAEADLIAMYRILDDHGREDVFDFVTMKYEKATGEKGSIYSTYIEDENARKKSGPLLGLDAQDGTA